MTHLGRCVVQQLRGAPIIETPQKLRKQSNCINPTITTDTARKAFGNVACCNIPFLGYRILIDSQRLQEGCSSDVRFWVSFPGTLNCRT